MKAVAEYDTLEAAEAAVAGLKAAGIRSEVQFCAGEFLTTPVPSAGPYSILVDDSVAQEAHEVLFRGCATAAAGSRR